MDRRRVRTLMTAAICFVAGSGCSPMVHVTTETDPTDRLAPPEQLRVNLHVRTEAMEVAISNVGVDSVEVLWSGASLVDTEGNISPVVHSRVASGFAAADVAGNVARIGPNSTLDGFVIPNRNVIFDKDAGWYADPLLPVECGPLRCTGYHELVGKSLRLTLPMRVNGADVVFASTLRITDAVKSVRGGRPAEPAR